MAIFQNGMNNSWKNIKNTFNSIVSKKKYEDNKGIYDKGPMDLIQPFVLSQKFGHFLGTSTVFGMQLKGRG